MQPLTWKPSGHTFNHSSGLAAVVSVLWELKKETLPRTKITKRAASLDLNFIYGSLGRLQDAVKPVLYNHVIQITPDAHLPDTLGPALGHSRSGYNSDTRAKLFSLLHILLMQRPVLLSYLVTSKKNSGFIVNGKTSCLTVRWCRKFQGHRFYFSKSSSLGRW